MTNKVFTVTGPSCGGKTTLVRKLLDTGVFCEILSFTSRQPRGGEIEGVDYNFVTIEQAQKLIEEDQVAESTNFKGNYYGILRSEIDRKLKSGLSPVVIVEPHGLTQLRDKYDCVSIYVDSTLQTLYERFLLRFRESPDANVEYEAKRLMSIKDELIDWRHKFSPTIWSMFLHEVNRQNEKEVVNSITQHALSLN